MVYKLIFRVFLLIAALYSTVICAATNNSTATNNPCSKPQLSADDPAGSSTNIMVYYLCLISQNLMTGYPNQSPTSIAGDSSGGTSSATSTYQAIKSANALTTSQVANMVYPTGASALNSNLYDLLGKFLSSKGINSSILNSGSSFSSGNNNTSQSILTAIAPNFSMSTLVNQNGITTGNIIEAEAMNFILFLSGQPIIDPPLTPDQLDGSSTLIKNYVAGLAAFASQQSTGVSVLNNLLKERTIQQGNHFNDALGNPVGASINVSNTQDMSPLQVDEYMATRRIGNQNWYNAIQAANPAQLSQESLVLLAQINYQMLQQRMQLEQLNATLASIQLTLTNTLSRDELAKAKQNALKAIIDPGSI
jgi:hypothetical protein